MYFYRPPNTLKITVILTILHLNCCTGSKIERSVADFGQGVPRLPATNDDDSPDIEPIYGSQNYRINGMITIVAFIKWSFD